MDGLREGEGWRDRDACRERYYLSIVAEGEILQGLEMEGGTRGGIDGCFGWRGMEGQAWMEGGVRYLFLDVAEGERARLRRGKEEQAVGWMGGLREREGRRDMPG